MLAHRIAQQSLRRLATQPNAYRFAAPAAVALAGVKTPKRLVTTQPITPTQARDEILAKQRLARPVAPHLSIYRPQITWYGSAANRVTGLLVSGAFYGYGLLYLVAPVLGWHVESATLAAAFAAWPVALQVLTKFTVALPFTYHCLNGLRHLVWDTAKMISNQKVARSGWVAVGASVVSALALALV